MNKNKCMLCLDLICFLPAFLWLLCRLASSFFPQLTKTQRYSRSSCLINAPVNAVLPLYDVVTYFNSVHQRCYSKLAPHTRVFLSHGRAACVAVVAPSLTQTADTRPDAGTEAGGATAQPASHWEHNSENAELVTIKCHRYCCCDSNG